MKKALLLCIPFLLWADNYQDLTTLVDNSLKIKQVKEQVDIQKARVSISKAKNYGSLDLNYNATYLQDNPTMSIQHSGTFQAGMKDNYMGEIVYSYPLFSGFAISGDIDKAKLSLIKEELNLKNTKRVLTLKTARLYSLIYTQKKLIKALLFSKEAILSAKKQVQLSYKVGLMDKHEVDDIDAKYYDIIAQIKEAQSNKKTLLANLSYLLNSKIDSIGGLPAMKQIDFTTPHIASRADLLAISKELEIDSADIKIAKSRFYPTVNVQAALKREANLALLNKNYYQNVNKSYVTIGVSYNFFSGGADKAQLEAARIKKLSTGTFYDDYFQEATTNYKNTLDQYQTLQFQRTAAQKEKVARKSYYSYIYARFKQGLVNSIDLNYAISQLAASKAKLARIQADIFFLYETLLLDGHFSNS